MSKLNTIFRIKLVYYIVFISLAFWALFAYFTMSQLITSQEIYAKIINISGKQRMLSQKTTLMAKRSFETKDKKLLKHTIELIESMKSDHNYLINNLTSQNMKDIYFKDEHKLNKKVKKYFEIFDHFLKNMNKEKLKEIEEYSFNLLPELNLAVYEFEKESNKKTKQLKSREFIILMGTILTLFLEALIIVLPSIKLNEKKEKELEELNIKLEKRLNKELTSIREKDKIINEQSKMILMRQVLNSISHQWRQPLSIITTLASGLKLKKEYDQLTDEEFNQSLEKVIDNSNYLSKTLDDFRSFFENKDEITTYNFKKIIANLELLLKKELEKNKIKIFTEIENINYYGHETRLLNSLIYILHNSIDILKNKEGQRVIFIKIYKNKNIHIQIKDNGGGIKEDSIDKIFDPYFTTKHESLGKGMDLYIVKETIEKIIKGNIHASNKNFKFKGKSEKGALIEIILPVR